MKNKQYTKEQIDYLRNIAKGKKRKDITKLFNEKFNEKKTVGAISGVLVRNKIKTGYDGRFKKGDKPWNKGTKGVMKANSGTFKKGHQPANKRPIGSERITKDGYVEIKVEEPDKWDLKHRVLYEKYHNVKLIKDDVILFGDKDKMNFDKNNLIKIDRAQLAMLNKRDLIQDHPEATRSAVYLVDLTRKISNLEG